MQDVGETMTWGEAWSLTNALAADPESRVHAALAGWDHPRSFEWFMLADLWDLLARINTPKGKKAATYPRPGDKGKRVAKPGLSQEQVYAALRYAGHTNLPTAAA